MTVAVPETVMPVAPGITVTPTTLPDIEIPETAKVMFAVELSWMDSKASTFLSSVTVAETAVGVVAAMGVDDMAAEAMMRPSLRVAKTVIV